MLDENTIRSLAARIEQVPAGFFTAPRVEVELAFILSKRLCGPGCTMFDVLNATDFLIPSSPGRWESSPAPSKCYAKVKT
jgi:2-keto-4-pentenoate hydratase